MVEERGRWSVAAPRHESYGEKPSMKTHRILPLALVLYAASSSACGESPPPVVTAPTSTPSVVTTTTALPVASVTPEVVKPVPVDPDVPSADDAKRDAELAVDA